MIAIPLKRGTGPARILNMREWLMENNTYGYIGEGLPYILDMSGILFDHIAYIPKEDDAIMFKLIYGL